MIAAEDVFGMNPAQARTLVPDALLVREASSPLRTRGGTTHAPRAAHPRSTADRRDQRSYP